MSAADDPTLAPEDATRTGARGRATAAVSRKIGRFSILEEIGAGGMGVVYAAYDDKLDRRVALKVLQAWRGDGADRMLREAQAMARVSHPNVLPVYEVGEHEGSLYIAMEFVHGQTLGEWVRSASPTWREILGVYARAGRGLAAAHDAGVVHRDFKPHNVMVDTAPGDDGALRVRVLDFGLAGRAAEVEATVPDPPSTGSALDRSLTDSGAVMGTPAYMSPEQIGGEAVTPGADQFSFCIAVWEGVFGERPFVGEGVAAMFDAVLAGRIQTPPAKDVPKWVESTLRRGLDVVPANRWPDMRALVAELERERGRTRRRIVAALGVGAVVAVAAVAMPRSESCEGAPAGLEDVWSEERSAEIYAAMAAVDVDHAGATAAFVTEQLRTYAEAWGQARREACAEAVEAEDAAAVAEKVRCLGGRLRSLDALVDVLATPGPETLEHAPAAVGRLPDIASCDDADALVELRQAVDLRREHGGSRDLFVDAALLAIVSARAGEKQEASDALAIARAQAEERDAAIVALADAIVGGRRTAVPPVASKAFARQRALWLGDRRE